MTNDKLIAGLKALVAEANAHLDDIRKDLDAAIKREKRATREGRWDAILCERDKISQLLDREFIHLGRAKTNLARIAELQAEAK